MTTTGAREEAAAAFEQALLDDHPGLLYEQAPCGYLSTDARGRILKANQTLLTWLGYELPDLRGRQLVDLLTPGGRIYHETHYAPLLQMQGAVREIALDLVRADGTRLPVLLNARLARTQRDDLPVVRLAIFDATERRQYERELLLAKEAAEAASARSRTLAKTLQRTLIPPSLPAVDGLELAARFLPAGDGSEVGGDFYDVFPAGLDDWVVMIGDVCGKGPEAAVVTALARYTVHGLATGREISPASLLRRLNEVLLAENTDRFVSLVLGRLTPSGEAWTLHVAAGGHPPGLLLRDGAIESFPLDGGLVGLFEDVAVEERTVTLAPGEAMVFFTDGVTEARAGGELFGEERVAEVIRGGGDADELAGRLLQAVLDFQPGSPRDDVAILVLRVPS